MASTSICAEIAVNAIAAAEGGGVKNFVNVYHFQRTSPAGTLVKTAVETAFQAAIVPTLVASISADYTQIYNTIRMVDDALDPVQAVTRSSVGAITGVRLPDFNAATIRMNSAVRGRFARGSKHLGPIGDSQTLGDTLVSGSITLLRAHGAAVLAGFTDANGNVWLPVILSRKPPAKYNANPTILVTYQCIATVVNLTVGTMKRRKVRSLSS